MMTHDHRGYVCTVESPCAVGRSASDLVHGIDKALAVGRSGGPAGSGPGAGATSGAAPATRVGCMLGLPQLKRRIRVLEIGAGVARQLLWATA